MIVAYHNRGVGGGAGPVEYLLGKDFDREKAELLRGDPEMIRDTIDSLEFKKGYTSGLISFNETDLPHETKEAIMDEFERATFTGLDKDQYSILWVEHSDKSNLELNFVIPNVELNSGKSFYPYYDPVDRQRINQFRDIQNIKYDLKNPLSKEHEQSISINKDLPRSKKELVEKLDQFFLQGIEKGTINNRNDIKEQIELAGYEIARETDKSLSIANPSGGQNIRLKGAIYERSFQSSQQAREERQRDIREFKDKQRAGYERLQEQYEKSLRIKSERVEKLYGKNKQNNLERNPNELLRGVSRSLGDLRADLRSSSNTDNKTQISNRGIDQDKKPGISPGGLEDNRSRESGRGKVPDVTKGSRELRMGREHISKEDKINDRNRDTITSSLKGFRDRARESAERFREKITGFGEGLKNSLNRIQDTFGRERPANEGSKDFGQQIKSLDKAIGKEMSKNRSRSKGMSIGGFEW